MKNLLRAMVVAPLFLIAVATLLTVGVIADLCRSFQPQRETKP